MDVALVTCLQPPEPDPDQEPLLAALRAHGLSADAWAWDAPGLDWAATKLAVIRSTWDYHHRLDEFLAWVDRTAAHTQLANPPQLVHANVRKTYLRDLQAAGVPVVPTVWCAQGERCDLARMLDERGWQRAVIKPVVSAGSWGTLLVDRDDPGDASQRHLDALIAERGVMVQPYLESVEQYGERALVWIDGELRHAVRKARRLAGDEESVSQQAVAVAADEAELAAQVLRAAVGQTDDSGSGGGGLLYARVDLARDSVGQPLLMELELVEPSLFLLQATQSLEALASAIVARVRGAAGSA